MRNRIILACAVVLGVCSFQAMADDQENCSLRSLRGTYNYASTSVVGDNLGQLQVGEAGIESFDGNGNVVNHSTTNTGGHLPASTNNVISGTYTVNADCRGTISYSSGEVEAIYVNPNGEGFTYVTANGTDGVTNALVGDEKRISRKLLVQAPPI